MGISVYFKYFWGKKMKGGGFRRFKSFWGKGMKVGGSVDLYPFGGCF